MSKTKDLHKLKIQKHNSRTWFLSHLWGCRIHCKYDQIGSKQTSTRTFKWSWSSPHHGGAKTKVGHCGWEVQLARIVSCQTHLRDLSAAIATATTKTITSTTTTTTTTNNNKQTNKKQNYTKNSNNNNNDSNSKEQNIWIAQEYEDLNTATPFVHQAVKSDLKELVVSVVEKCYQKWVLHGNSSLTENNLRGLWVITTPLLNSSNGRFRSAVRLLLNNLIRLPCRSWNLKWKGFI